MEAPRPARELELKLEVDARRERPAVALKARAAEIDLGAHLVLGSGEKKSGGYRRASILADALEAIFGAIYLDAGFDAVDAVIRRVFSARAAALPEPDALRQAIRLLLKASYIPDRVVDGRIEYWEHGAWYPITR